MMLFSPLFSVIMNKIGRKYTILCIAVPHLIAWITTALADSIYMFYISRVFNGIGDAGIFTALPAYVGEISTPKVRGFWGNLATIGIYLGEFLINLIGSFLSIKETAYLCSVLPILFIILFAFMPETPYYLLMKGKEEEAKTSLQKLRMKKNVDGELKQLQLDVMRQVSEPSGFKDLFTIDSNRKALLICSFCRFAQQFSGISSFVVYNQYIFKQTGMDIDYKTSSNIFIGTMFLCNFLACFTLDKLGRRMTMITSCAGSTVVLLTLIIYFYLIEYTDVDLSLINWYPILGMLLYTIIYSLGLGIVPTLLLSEIFSTSVKGHALTLMNFGFGIYASSSTKIFQILTTHFGLVGPIILFTFCCFFSTIIFYLYMPETKGKTLEEIQQTLKGNRK